METEKLSPSALLKKLREDYPVFRDFKPLKLRIHKDLEAQQVIPRNMLRPTLGRHTGDRRYLFSIAAGGARYAIDGTEIGEVTPEEQQIATKWLKEGRACNTNAHSVTAKKKDIEVITMHANTVKVTLVVTDFERHLNVDSIGAASVPITIESGTAKLTATLNPKSFRKAQAAFKAADGQAAVVVSGELDIATGTIKSAGIAVQPKAVKAASAIS